MRRMILAAFTGLVLGLTSVAVASIPDSNGVIHACRDTRNGALRAIDTEAGQQCGKNETPLTWNQTGPQGPGGISGYQIVTASFAWPGGSGSIGGTLEAQCPSGKKVLGGGWNSRELDVPNLRVHWSYPDASNNWWSIRYSVVDATAAFTLTTYATCAIAS
jgi:hypothetical protein